MNFDKQFKIVNESGVYNIGVVLRQSLDEISIDIKAEVVFELPPKHKRRLRDENIGTILRAIEFFYKTKTPAEVFTIVNMFANSPELTLFARAFKVASPAVAKIQPKGRMFSRFMSRKKIRVPCAHSERCVVCMDARPDVLFLQCKHDVCCFECCKKLTRGNCPICRGKVTFYLQLINTKRHELDYMQAIEVRRCIFSERHERFNIETEAFFQRDLFLSLKWNLI